MSASDNICPICGEGHLTSLVGKNSVEYKGRTTELEAQYSVCDTCGSEQANAAQLRANKRAMIAFRKQVDGLLTGIEVRAVRARLGISQTEAARIFGGGPVAFSKYESDDVAQSEAMDKLLRLADSMPAAFANLQKGIEVELDTSGEWIQVAMERSRSQRNNLRIITLSQPMSEDIWKKTA